MDNRYLAAAIEVRMSIFFARRAVRRPTRVSYAQRTGIFLRSDFFFQTGDRTDFFLHEKFVPVQNTDTGAVISPVF